MIYFLLALVFLGTFFNIQRRNKNLVNVKATKIQNVSTLLSLIVSLFICHKFNNTLAGYILVLAFILFFYSSFICQGIGKRGFTIKVGGAMFLAFYAFERLKEVSVTKDTDYLGLSIDTFSGKFNHYYKKEDAEQIYNILEENKVKISYQ